MKTEQNIRKDFQKIKRCIDSCNTLAQLSSAERLIELFGIKYQNDPNYLHSYLKQYIKITS